MNKKIIYGLGVVVLVVVAIVSIRSINSKKKPDILSEKDTKESAEKANVQTTDETAGQEEGMSEEEFNKIYSDLTKQCEEGQWVEVAKVEGTKTSFTGKFSVDVPFEEDEEAMVEDERETYYLNGNKEIVSADSDTLGFFEGREVEISGVDRQGKIEPEKIRCIGKDTDKSVIAFRQQVMDKANKDINSLAPQKGKWEVYDIAWPADDHIYVDFATVEDENADSESIDENIYSLLLQVNQDGGNISFKQVAYLKMSSDEDAEDWELISGDDKFKDLEDMDYYEYDETMKKWVK